MRLKVFGVNSSQLLLNMYEVYRIRVSLARRKKKNLYLLPMGIFQEAP